ncbi:hypothetical protein FRB94_002674 [Tulasnella sp. JGI-2019a]|nr:hypothetical protein FRB94_002674 [Tulasnella sp. JGI-2019a]
MSTDVVYMVAVTVFGAVHVQCAPLQNGRRDDNNTISQFDTRASGSAPGAAIGVGVTGATCVILAVAVLSFVTYRRRKVSRRNNGLHLDPSTPHSSKDKQPPRRFDEVMSMSAMGGGDGDVRDERTARPAECTTFDARGGARTESPLGDVDPALPLPSPSIKEPDEAHHENLSARPSITVDTRSGHAPSPSGTSLSGVSGSSHTPLIKNRKSQSLRAPKGQRSSASLRSNTSAGSHHPHLPSPNSPVFPTQITIAAADSNRLSSQQLLVIHGLVRRGVDEETIATAVRQMLGEPTPGTTDRKQSLDDIDEGPGGS